ncbi:MAG TPA: MrtC family glutamic-type intramembrane protease [Polyangiaceae bacterium]
MSASPTVPDRRALAEGLGVAVVVTGLVTLASLFVPTKHVATVVGLVFLGATWALVWRRDDAVVEKSGLAFGGLVLPGEVDWKRVVRSFGVALAWAIGTGAIVFVPFYFGWRWWWHPTMHFSIEIGSTTFLNDAAGQLLMIALPEEAFYRGYLQSRFDDAFTTRWRIFGAVVSPSLFLTSAVFALGHLATVHDVTRLAVFFPSLLFGWLRARTRGVGADTLFHAFCNIFSETLGRGFGLY